jgi:hypothetical protein
MFSVLSLSEFNTENTENGAEFHGEILRQIQFSVGFAKLRVWVFIGARCKDEPSVQ